MKRTLLMAIGLLILVATTAEAQRGDRRGRNATRSNSDRIGDSNPLPIGASGVAWYTTWDTGLAEAKRSNRPIFFMSAATTCSGVPGVF